MNRLRNNYKLSNILARIAFVLTFMLANWQNMMASSIMVLGEANLLLALFSGSALGVGLMFLVPALVKWALNMFQLHSVPRAEFCVLVEAFFALGFLIRALLNTVHLFTPLLLVWGNALFPLISSLIAALLFYRVTSKLYFNDVTVVYYFRAFATVYLVIALVAEVL